VFASRKARSVAHEDERSAVAGERDDGAAAEHRVDGPYATTIDGLPALHLVAEGTNVAGNEIVVRSVLTFDGETEYAIDCEYSPTKEDEMRPACAQVFDTFVVD
jgi:hypothetical protein